MSDWTLILINDTLALQLCLIDRVSFVLVSDLLRHGCNNLGEIGAKSWKCINVLNVALLMCERLMLHEKLELSDVKSETNHFGARFDVNPCFMTIKETVVCVILKVNAAMMLKAYSWVVHMIRLTRYDGKVNLSI
jgi:hypothetical protein